MKISNTPPTTDKRTKKYKEWKKAFDEQNSIGLGDVVESVTEATGIKKAVEFFTPDGKDCGCTKRKEKLNRLRFRFKPLRCFTEQHYNTWIELRKLYSFTRQDQLKMFEIYAHLFAIQHKPKSCCLESYINDIDRVFNEYQL